MNINLTAFHAALMNGGVFLYIPKNVEVTEPIQAYLFMIMMKQLI